MNNFKYLNELEERSIYIIREAYWEYKDKLAVLWSMGKDSTTLVYLIRKAFFGRIPIAIIHIDTTFKFKEIYEFRERLTKQWNLNLTITQKVKSFLSCKSKYGIPLHNP